MARPRTKGRKLLPDNLYVQKRAKGDYFSYRRPITGQSKSLGYDRTAAIEAAERLNRDVTDEHFVPAGLLSHQEIVDQSYPFGGYPGVYFLVSKGQVMYVGKSSDVEFRLGQHRARRQIEFDAVFIVPCRLGELSRLEARYIRMLKPPMNSAFPLGVLPAYSMEL